MRLRQKGPARSGCFAPAGPNRERNSPALRLSRLAHTIRRMSTVSSRQQFESKLAALVEKFKRHHADYKRADYSEAQARLDFINPFFEALGWDVRNEAGLGPKEREVVVEQGQTTGRPDYNFRLEGRTVFFVEAKAPHVPIDRADVIMQAKSYAWSSQDVFVSAVTDFEEIRLYDASAKPDRKHPDVGLIFSYQYADYLKPKTLDDLWLLSREAVAAGSIDQLLKMSGIKARQKLPVDQAFLDDLTEWRERLAKAVYKSNPDMDVADLNSVVQVFLDRLIFIRIAEDRGILPPRGLEDIARAWEHSGKRRPLAPDLNALFHDVNRLLNGEIFKPHLCEKVNWDADSALVAGIIGGLYFPQCPYRFDAIGVELLGSIYERYLGKTIRVTATRAVVEEKPEVRKAGGVYYTPRYVVEYIVENTVGKLIEGKTPKQIAKLRILDPACGSGSFLLGAYQKLLDYHERRKAGGGKQEAGRGEQPRLVGEGEGGEYRLSLAEKAAILRNNIYGVDIDPQAVEITMMSLYIKMLEGERGAIKGLGVLPPLRNNIKYGNSLISSLTPTLTPSPSPSGRGAGGEVNLLHLNPFDWESKSEGFGEIMAAGGFDAVIGNPPYIRIQVMKEWASVEVELYKQIYRAASSGNYDIYVVFVEKGLSLLNKRGRLGFILPHKFFNAQYGEPLRSLIARGKHLAHVVHFGDQQVFAGATTYTCLMFLDKGGSEQCEFAKVNDLDEWRESGEATEGTISSSNVTTAEWNFAVGRDATLIEKLGRMPVKLGNVADLFVGLQTDADDVFIVEEIRQAKGRVLCKSKATEQEHWFENDHLKMFLKGSLSIRRYHLADATKRLIFPYEITDGKSVLIESKEYKQRYPLTWKYLEGNRARLSSRNKGRMGQDWHGYVYKKNHTRFDQPKLLVPSIATGSCFAVDLSGSFYFVGSGGGGGGGYGITLHKDVVFSSLYLLGLLNSKLLSAYLKSNSTPFRGGYIALNRQYIEQLPIRPINFSDPADKKRHDDMGALVERMLELHKQKAAAAGETARARIEREINVTDEKIDALVYELYGLADEEVDVVEGG